MATADVVEQIIRDLGDISPVDKYALRKQLRTLVLVAQVEHLAAQLDMLQVRAIQEGTV